MGRPALPIGTAGRVRIYHDADGSWRARTMFRDYDGVNREIQRRASTKGAAERALALALRDRSHLGGDGDLKPESKVAQVAEAWFSHVASQDRSPKTLEAYRGCLDRVVLPGLGALRVKELSPAVVDRFLRSVSANRGPATAKMARSVVSGLCGYAVRSDLIVFNPTREVSPTPRKPKRLPKSLSVEQMRELRQKLHADERSIELDLPDFVDMMMATGLRIGECSALVWDTVDLESKSVEVHGTVVRLKGIGTMISSAPKTQAGYRTLYLPTWCVVMLQSRATGTVTGTSPVFPAPMGGLRDPSNTQRALRGAFDRAGFPDITSHVLRKSVATAMDRAGLSARAAADQLGHAQVWLTQNTYFGRKIEDTGAAQVLEQLG